MVILARITESGADINFWYCYKWAKRPLLHVQVSGAIRVLDQIERSAIWLFPIKGICRLSPFWIIFISRKTKFGLLLHNRCWMMSGKPRGEHLDLHSPLHVSPSLVYGHVLIHLAACHSSRPDALHATVLLTPGWDSNPGSFRSWSIALPAEPLALLHLLLFIW